MNTDTEREMPKKAKDEYTNLVGDGKAKVHRMVTLGMSKEIGRNFWVKADVGAICELSCNQDEATILKAGKLAQELASSWASDEFGEANSFIDSFKS